VLIEADDIWRQNAEQGDEVVTLEVQRTGIMRDRAWSLPSKSSMTIQYMPLGPEVRKSLTGVMGLPVIGQIFAGPLAFF